jgi:hypothetical protein
VIPLLLAVLAACRPEEEPAVDDAIALGDATNYRLATTLDIAPVEVGALADLSVGWEGLTHDLLGRAVVPDDVSGMDLVWFRNLDLAALERAVVSGDLSSADVGLLATWSRAPGATSARLSEFSFLTNPFRPEEYLVETSGTWLLRLKTPTDDDAMLLALVPIGGNPTTAVAFADTSATLTVDADLHSAAPLLVDPGTPPVVDWSGLGHDGRGAAVVALQIQELLVARYDDMDVGDLEATFLDLEAEASVVYRLDAYGLTRADLAEASADADAFPGFDAEHLWLVGLACTTCMLPSPIFLGRVDVR